MPLYDHDSYPEDTFLKGHIMAVSRIHQIAVPGQFLELFSGIIKMKKNLLIS